MLKPEKIMFLKENIEAEVNTRKMMGLTQEYIAKKCFCSQKQISLFENGFVNNLELFLKYRNVLENTYVFGKRGSGKCRREK